MKIALIAGGSGGHLIPALALAEYLSPSNSCFLISTARPVDRLLAARTQNGSSSHIDWMTIDLKQIRPFYRWLSPAYTRAQIKAVRDLWSFFGRLKPDIVVGFGGYLSAVGVTAARLRGVPAVVHEQNLVPGKANRFLAGLVNAVAVTFPETKNHLSSRALVEVTGNPVRPVLKEISFEEARQKFQFDLTRPVLLVMGGSQGASSINRFICAMFDQAPDNFRRGIQVIHLAGEKEASLVQAHYQRMGMDARVFGFFHEMPTVYRAATVAVSRAGATSLTEIMQYHLPSLLIPYPHAGGHQKANAAWLEQRGGAVLLEERNCSAGILTAKLKEILFSPERLSQMRSALMLNGNGSAVERLASLVQRIVG